MYWYLGVLDEGVELGLGLPHQDGQLLHNGGHGSGGR